VVATAARLLYNNQYKTLCGKWGLAVEKNIVAQLLREYEQYTKSEKKVVDYVLAHPQETQHSSITDLSAACDVALSTISVFCRKLQLAGFNDFKLALARAASLSEDAPDGGDIKVSVQDSLETVMDKSRRAAQSCISKTSRMLQEPAIRRAVELLMQARQVVCLGQGSCTAAAAAAWTLFSTVSGKFRSAQDPHMQTVLLSTLSPLDLVVYFASAATERQAAAAARLIGPRGARMLLISPTAPTGFFVDTTLLYDLPVGPFTSTIPLVAQLYVLDVLFQEFCRRAPEETAQFRESAAKALAQEDMAPF